MDASFFHWNGNPEIFRIGSFAIRWYGVLFALGFLLGYQIMNYIFKREKKPIRSLETLTFYVVIGTIVGARLGHCLFYEPEYYLSNPLEILQVWHGGLASHGGAIGILIALLLYFRKEKKLELIWFLDRLAIPIPLAATFIRIGNFFNHEILGKPTDLPWAVVFNVFKGGAVVGQTQPVHPTQLYEAIAYFLIFILLFVLYKIKVDRPKGFLFGMMLTAIFVARFLIEFTKEFQADFEQYLPLTMGQILSIPFIIAGVYLIAKAVKSTGKNN